MLSKHDDYVIILMSKGKRGNVPVMVGPHINLFLERIPSTRSSDSNKALNAFSSGDVK